MPSLLEAEQRLLDSEAALVDAEAVAEDAVAAKEAELHAGRAALADAQAQLADAMRALHSSRDALLRETQRAAALEDALEVERRSAEGYSASVYADAYAEHRLAHHDRW